MHIREYTASDLESLRRLHSAQGMPYAFPDLTNPLFLTKLVIERDSPDADSREAGDIPIDRRRNHWRDFIASHVGSIFSSRPTRRNAARSLAIFADAARSRTH